jgi:hypothetical protein
VKPSVGPSSTAKKPALTVTTNAKKEDTGIHTLIGDYEEVGANHGKKFYRKVQEIEGHEDVKVFLYYWDNRDGADFSGYWFGDEVGGTQVWARCNSHGNVPPVAGWKFPWDAMKSEPGLLTVGPYKASSASAPAVKPEAPKQAAPALGGGKPKGAFGNPAGNHSNNSNGVQAEVDKLTEQCDSLDAAAKEIVAHSKSLSEESEADVINETVESLQQHQKQLMDFQKTLTQEIVEARKGGAAANPKVIALSKLSPKLRMGHLVLQQNLISSKAYFRTLRRKRKKQRRWLPTRLRKLPKRRRIRN